MMNVKRKPVHIQTSNKWATRPADIEGELEVELDRLTICEDKFRSRKEHVRTLRLKKTLIYIMDFCELRVEVKASSQWQ